MDRRIIDVIVATSEAKVSLTEEMKKTVHVHPFGHTCTVCQP